MVLQRGLAAAGDEDEFLDPGGLGLLDRVLQHRLVDDAEHLLRHRLGGGQRPGAETRDGKHGYLDGFGHEYLLPKNQDARLERFTSRLVP
jgi:hypothetical protein